MKLVYMLIVALIEFSAIAQTNLPIFRGPPVSESFSSNMVVWDKVAQNQNYPKNLIMWEGENSDSYSSAQSCRDYFAIYNPNLPNGGTILELSPIWTYYNGVLGNTITFRDVLNNTNYNVVLSHTDNGNSGYDQDGYISGVYITGSFVIGGQTIWMKIKYRSTPRYPSVQLTWGKNSGFGEVGAIYDDLSNASVESDPPPTTTELSIINAVNIPDIPNGMYVAVYTRDENYTLQSTTNLKLWVDEPKPFYIIGYVGLHYYPQTEVVGNKFFRSKR